MCKSPVQLSCGEEYGLVDEPLLLFQSSEFAFCNFVDELKTQKDRAELAKRQREVHISKARFTQEVVDVEKCGGSCRPVLYEKDQVEILHRQILMSGNDQVFFLGFESESNIRDIDRFQAENSD